LGGIPSEFAVEEEEKSFTTEVAEGCRGNGELGVGARESGR